jgi:hypothetical protein
MSFFGDLVSDLFGGDSWFGKKVIKPLGELGEGIYKPLAGEETTAQKKEAQEADAAARAAAEAARKQSLFEASEKEGLERLALRRKRGFGQSILAAPVSSLGSSSTLGS